MLRQDNHRYLGLSCLADLLVVALSKTRATRQKKLTLLQNKKKGRKKYQDEYVLNIALLNDELISRRMQGFFLQSTR